MATRFFTITFLIDRTLPQKTLLIIALTVTIFLW